jgi:hypothetical protein
LWRFSNGSLYKLQYIIAHKQKKTVFINKILYSKNECLFSQYRINFIVIDLYYCIMRSFITCTLLQVRMIKSRRMRWSGHVARIGEKRKVWRILVGKPEGKRPLGRPRYRWVDDIKMDLIQGGVVWTGLI